MGYYSKFRDGIPKDNSNIQMEIKKSLKINPQYRHIAHFYAGDEIAAEILEQNDLNIHHIITDAPEHVLNNSVHRMKHWICYKALKEFGEFIWIDWDTILLGKLNDAFYDWCRRFDTPKFVYIPDYQWGVNCGVYYANTSWLEPMKESFKVSHFNDEMLWQSILPPNYQEMKEYWWGSLVVNISDLYDPLKLEKNPNHTARQFGKITKETVFVHIKNLDQYKDIRSHYLSTLEGNKGH